MNVLKDDRFKDEILELLPDAVVWVAPVTNEQEEVIDFEVIFCNKKANELTNHPHVPMEGLRILKNGIPDKAGCADNFKNFLQVYHSNRERNFTFYAGHSNLTVETIRRPFRGGVLSTTRDRTAQREAERKELEQTKLLKGIIEHSRAGIVVYEALRDSGGTITDFKTKLANDAVQELTYFSREEREKLTLKELLQFHNAVHVFEQYVKTVETGEPFSFEFYYKQIDKWLSYLVSKHEDGFLLVITDFTDKKKNEIALQQQSAFTNSVLNSSLNGIYTLKAKYNTAGEIEDFEYLFVNSITAAEMGMRPEDIKGRTVLEIFPENKENGFLELFAKVLKNGEPEKGETYFQTAKIQGWYGYVIVKMNEYTLAVTVQDITKQKLAIQQIERQKVMLDNILTHSSSGISVSKMLRDEHGKVFDAITVLANDAAVQFTGIPREVYLSKTARQLDPAIMQSPYYHMVLQTLETGVPFHSQYFLEPFGKWLETSVSKMDDEHIITIFTDITNTKQAQLQLEHAAERLSAVFNSAQSGMFTFAPVYNTAGEVVDFRFVITNPTFAQYVGQTPEVLNGQLGSTWFPGYLTNGVFNMYKQTYLTGQTQRMDLHYNVDGHDLFLDLLSTKVGDEVLVTFNDYSALKKAQLQLEQYVEELKRSNANLEEFAYAASHDLKEPIRKINIFTSSLRNSLDDRLQPSEVGIFDRVKTSTDRMTHLVDDLLEFSHVSRERLHQQFEYIDLNHKLEKVLEDLELVIQEKNAQVNVGPMPTVKGHRRQMQQVFQNLISNAIKYSKPGTPPIITITATSVPLEEAKTVLPPGFNCREYYLIQVKDNGIGFEQQYAEKIFHVFQRLHGKAEYSGTGVGLAIVKKVVQNHNGFITATSEPGVGSTFKVYLPAV